MSVSIGHIEMGREETMPSGSQLSAYFPVAFKSLFPLDTYYKARWTHWDTNDESKQGKLSLATYLWSF